MDFTQLLQIEVMLPWVLGMMFGVFVGATPGLTATMAVALIVPISFHLEPTAGLAMIIGVSFTAIFAGDIPATYLRIPGTPASAAATLDGHELAKQGRGEHALLLDLFCSAIGGLVGVVLLILAAPQLAKFALRFSTYEYFWLGLTGLCVSATVSRSGTVKGLLAAGLGMLLSTVGTDATSGAQRFTFGSLQALDGLQFIPAMIGLFGLSEVLRHVSRSNSGSPVEAAIQKSGRGSPLTALATIWKHKWTAAKSAVVGVFIGALPGAGADIAAWGAYGLAQKTSKNAKQFGKGTDEGVIAPTSANNAAVGGAWIPALVFGVPGDAVTAIVLGALLMYDIKSGPMIFEQSGDQVRSIFQIAFITQFLLLFVGYLAIRAFGLVLRLPRGVVMISVVIFSVVGAFALRNSLFDVWVMLAFGGLGYFLEAKKFPLAPLILGMILGPMVEENLRASLIAESGNFAPFFTRPICVALALVLVAAFSGRWVWQRVGSRRSGSQ